MTTLRHRFYLMRHGQSEANVAGIIASRLTDVALDPPLTEVGRRTVFEISERFRRESGLGVISVVASPFLRARQTAAILAEVFETTYSIDDRLRERDFGAYDRTTDQNYQLVWNNDRRGLNTDTVELLASVFSRVDSLIRDLDATHISGATVLCTHGDIISIAIAGYSQHDLSQHRDVGAAEPGEIIPLPR